MRAVPLSRPMVEDVFARRREVDRREYAVLTPTGSDAGHAEALVAVSRFGAAILDDSGSPQAVIGVVPAGTPDAWLCWMCATDAWADVWRTAYRWVCETLEPALLACGDVRRVTALVAAANLPAQRFMRAWGFEPEGVHRAVGSDGSDWITMARVRS